MMVVDQPLQFREIIESIYVDINICLLLACFKNNLLYKFGRHGLILFKYGGITIVDMAKGLEKGLRMQCFQNGTKETRGLFRGESSSSSSSSSSITLNGGFFCGRFNVDCHGGECLLAFVAT